MNPDEYAVQQALISSAVVNYVLGLGKFFTKPLLSTKDWLALLNLIFPEIDQRRTEAATLARTFYDYQRAQIHPDLPVNERLLESYQFDWFVQNMEPARKKMSQEDSPDDALGTLTLRAVREVENAGRRQIISAVQEEPEPKILRGWARVATGRETCSWCLMLVSRGPVYFGADTAGLDLPDSVAEKMFHSAASVEAFHADIDDYMDEWHDGCDCKVIPVFKNEGWFGEEAAARALDHWNAATLEANRIHDESPTTHPSGKNKGKPMTLNQEALNALRRRLNKGDISPSEFSALAA